ncbi:MAG: hypothetical protein D6737_20335 [Chloroflexi bacterium]|nr:MAG: hypothetical protein D6737_20335 [Chloroflexota bacterium]
MLLTVKIWRTLIDPPQYDPIFKQASKRIVTPAYGCRRYLHWIGRALQYLSLLATVLLLLFLTISAFLDSIGAGVSVLVVYLFLACLIVVVSAQINGLAWATRINGAVADTRDRNMYDLLAVTLPGLAWTLWTLSIGTIHRDNTLRWLHRAIIAIVLAFAIMLAVLLLPLLNIVPVATLDFRDQGDVLELWIVLLAIASTIYIDVMQSSVLGFVLGMTVSTFTIGPLENNIVTFGVYAFLQLSAYTMAVLGMVLLVPLVTENLLHLDDAANTALSALLSVGVFYVIREFIVAALWRLLAWRLHTERGILAAMI